MNNKEKITSLSFLIFITLFIIPTASAQTITQNGITITSDKDTYYCQPIISDYGCLITSKITIEYSGAQTRNIFFQPNFTTADMRIKSLSLQGAKIRQTRGRNDASIQIQNGDKLNFTLDFYTKKDGKFNVTIEIRQLGNNNLVAETILDPFFNTTINTTIPTLYLLNGTNVNTPNTGYEQTIDITTGLNDNNPSTQYLTAISQPYPETNPIIDGWSFNEANTPTTIQSFLGNHTANIQGLITPVSATNYYGARFDGSSYAIVPNASNSDFNMEASANMTICAVINTTLNTAGDTGIFSRRISTNGIGYELLYSGTEKARFVYEGASIDRVLTGTTNLNDGRPHLICGVKEQIGASTTLKLYVDGVQEDTGTNAGGLGAVNITQNIYFGSRDAGANLWNGTIYQMGVSRTNISQTFASFVNLSKQITNMSKGIAISVYFNHTINTTENYSIYIKANLTSEQTYVRIAPYINATHVNTTHKIDHLVTQGDNYIPVNSIVFNGYNQPFRIWDIIGGTTKISEIRLYEAVNDSTAPSITSCSQSTNNISCNQNITYTCNVTDNQAIDTIFYAVKHTDQTIHWHQPSALGGGIYTLTHQFTGTYNSSVNVSFSQVNATDLVSNKNITYPGLNATYTCLAACVEDWQPTYGSCLLNDSRIKTYTDTNLCGTSLSLPIDNGTYVACNYCSQNITSTIGTCTINNTQTITYNDTNYNTCCLLTGLVSDCAILYTPYNTTGSQTCDYLTQEFNCTLDSTPIINKKINLACELPTSEQHNCIVNVYQEQPNGSVLLATNPEYKKSSGSLLSLAQESEERTSFTTSGKLLNAYYTKKELRPNDNFKIEVLCYTNTTKLTYEKIVNPTYDTPDWAFNRSIWLQENATFAIFSIIVLILILLTLAWAIKKVRGR